MKTNIRLAYGIKATAEVKRKVDEEERVSGIRVIPIKKTLKNFNIRLLVIICQMCAFMALSSIKRIKRKALNHSSTRLDLLLLLSNVVELWAMKTLCVCRAAVNNLSCVWCSSCCVEAVVDEAAAAVVVEAAAAVAEVSVAAAVVVEAAVADCGCVTACK